MCTEFQRLKQEYERKLRVWPHYAFPLSEDVRQFPRRLSRIKYDSQIERDLAARALSAHRKKCRLCTQAETIHEE